MGRRARSYDKASAVALIRWYRGTATLQQRDLLIAKGLIRPERRTFDHTYVATAKGVRLANRLTELPADEYDALAMEAS